MRKIEVLAAWCVLWGLTGLAAAAEPSPREQELIAILRSDAPAADKAITCKRLAVQGSAASVEVLAPLLADEQLASWARIALEAIPAPEAGAALRKATESLSGRLLVGVLNSLGVRRDEEATDLFVQRLNSPDREVAEASAVALGRLGNDIALKALRERLDGSVPDAIRGYAAEGAVLCAERRWKNGDHASAVALYDAVRSADVPRPRIREATRGAILARPADAGIALLREQLKSREYDLFQIGLSTAREFPGSAVDQALAEELASAAPDRAALLVTAMADRPKTVVLAAILGAAASGPKEVRLSAIEALRRVGNVSCVPPLLQIGIEEDADLAQAVRKSLGDLPGKDVDQDILNRLAKADGPLYPLLIEVTGQRRLAATDELRKALGHADVRVRHAALVALGATVPQPSLSILIQQAIAPQHAADTDVARKALLAACVRMPDREACASELARALEGTALQTQVDLLPVLGAVGGTQALQTLAGYARRPEADLQDASSRLLGEWMTIDAADVLLDLSRTAPEEKYKIRALRGYIRIARQFVMPEADRVIMCQKALDRASQINEQKLILEVLKRYPSAGTLRLALGVAQKNPELHQDAHAAAVAIAQKLGPKGAETLEALKLLKLEPVKLEIVKAEYGAGSAQKDVTAVLQKQARDQVLIELPQSSYNEAFGGDPAPNVVKMLKVHYRMNGKDGQATFAENALILLTPPQ